MLDEHYNNSYLNYLKQRSRLAFFYRMNFLYPKINRHLGKKPLDVGCGIGDMLAFRNDIVGTDVNIEIVKYCQQNNHNVHLMEFDKLPFPDNTFDSVILDNVLEHIADPHALLLDIARVLCSKGTVIIGVPGQKGYLADNDHKRFYDLTNLKNTVSKAEFCVNTHFYSPFNFKFLGRYMTQHCLYVVMTKLK